MKFDKSKLKETLTGLKDELQPLYEGDMKKWVSRANIKKSLNEHWTSDYDKHPGVTLPEKLVHRLGEVMPLEGVAYNLVESNFGGRETVCVDYSDLMPVYLIIKCVDDDRFDYQVISDKEQVITKSTNETYEQLLEDIKEVYESCPEVRRKMGLKESIDTKLSKVESEEEFFKRKYQNLMRVYNHGQSSK